MIKINLINDIERKIRLLVTFFRAILLYIIVLIVMRLMGKREIGQLQPFELAISIMIADLASIPMTDTGVPISNGIIPILAFSNICCEFKEYKSKRDNLWKTKNTNI